jgi:gamma-butyrobetaine dioxygenase
LAQYFCADVSEPIRLHAQAKRYLCTSESHYYDTLSEASKYSLEKQGGFMTTAEIGRFKAHPYFDAAVRLRRWDDCAKDSNLRLDNFSAFRPTMLLLTNQ